MATDRLACIRPYLIPGHFGGCEDCHQIEDDGRDYRGRYTDGLRCACCGSAAYSVVHASFVGADPWDSYDYSHYDVCADCYRLVVDEFRAGGGIMESIDGLALGGDHRAWKLGQDRKAVLP